MLIWITEIEEPPFSSNDENGDLYIKRLDSIGQPNEMGPVCQFFAYFDVMLNENSLTSLPTPNDKALETILSEIVPHYVDVKQIFINGKLKEINVRCLKKESRKILENMLSNGIYPVVQDLYRTKNLNLATGPRKLKYYSVSPELITPLYLKETEEIWEFFISSFFSENGSIMLQPTGWKLEESLKESVTIRTFISFAKHIVLVVDDKVKSVIGLDIYA